MYSLYRAWLSMSHHQPPTSSNSVAATDLQAGPLPLNLSAASTSNTSLSSSVHQSANIPDVQLQVGPSLTNFSAHRNVLSAHSGFFKAALTNGTGSGPILVPNIQVDEFSSLLTFMYTGYLDLNLGNIYNILLATHILHMPRALELCRNYLMHTQPQQQQMTIDNRHHPHHHHPATTSATTSSIIKPIASRKPLPHIAQFQQQEEKTTKQTNEQQSENILNNHIEPSVFKKVKQKEDIGEEAPSTSTTKLETRPSTKQKNKPPLVPAAAASPAVQTGEAAITKSTKPNKAKRRHAMSTLTLASSVPSSQDDRVIVDIACCDGPVRFHRVINKNYGGTSDHQQAAHQGQGESGISKAKSKRTIITEQAMNKVMIENIKSINHQMATDAPADNEENTIAITANNNSNSNNSADLYTCLYCNHTFKSQYCYQKHARRHLNPVENPVKMAATVASGDCRDARDVNAAGNAIGNKREFKLLDMNVQYYPCKTCGSKFPSYYFVHKHRKLCHADEMADGNNKNNEIVQVKPLMNVNAETDVDIEDVDDEDVINDIKNDKNTRPPTEGGAASDISSDTNHSSHHSDTIIDVEETNDD